MEITENVLKFNFEPFFFQTDSVKAVQDWPLFHFHTLMRLLIAIFLHV